MWKNIFRKFSKISKISKIENLDFGFFSKLQFHIISTSKKIKNQDFRFWNFWKFWKFPKNIFPHNFLNFLWIFKIPKTKYFPNQDCFRSYFADFARNQYKIKFFRKWTVASQKIHSSSNITIYSDEIPELAHLEKNWICDKACKSWKFEA